MEFAEDPCTKRAAKKREGALQKRGKDGTMSTPERCRRCIRGERNVGTPHREKGGGSMVVATL